MATFNKVNSFTEDAGSVMNLKTDQLKVALTNTAPVATNAVYGDLTSPLATTNLSGATPFNITTTSYTQSSGTAKLILVDLTLTATGSVGPFRYVAVYDDTVASPVKPLIGWYDYGSSITLSAGETFLIDFDGTNGLLSIA